MYEDARRSFIDGQRMFGGASRQEGARYLGRYADLLADLMSYIERVVQKYLRSSYGTIDEFNAAAGEVAEPYRCLVLFDFPRGFTEETLARLQAIVANGPRCGVHVLIHADRHLQLPVGVDISQINGVAALALDTQTRVTSYSPTSRSSRFSTSRRMTPCPIHSPTASSTPWARERRLRRAPPSRSARS